MKKPSLLERVLNKVFNPIVNEINESKSLSEKSKERFNQSRRDFFNRSVPTIVASGVLSQQLLTKDLEPPKDSLVEQITEQAQTYGFPYISYMSSSAYPCFTTMATRAFNPNNLKEM